MVRMSMQAKVVSHLLGLVGAVVGGWLGYIAFKWIWAQGFYALVVPGGLLGLGCGIAARHPSTIRGILCGVAALALGLYTEWTFYPFRDDDSFSYLVLHAHQLKWVTLLMVALGGIVAYWSGKEGDIAGLARFGKPKPPADLA
jgi:hypothetical protein